MRAALEGADTLFLMPAAEAPDRVALHTTAIDAAVAAGVRRIVYLSFVGASPDNTFTLGRDHWHTEQHIRATGLPWTFLRMNLYMDFIPSMVSPTASSAAPPATGGWPRSCATTSPPPCAAVLTAGRARRPQTYDLTGPRRSRSARPPS